MGKDSEDVQEEGTEAEPETKEPGGAGGKVMKMRNRRLQEPFSLCVNISVYLKTLYCKEAASDSWHHTEASKYQSKKYSIQFCQFESYDGLIQFLENSPCWSLVFKLPSCSA